MSIQSLLSHKQRILLWGSLFLNVLLIGVILIGPPQHGKPGPKVSLTRMCEDLSAADQAIFETTLAKHQDALHQHDAIMQESLHDLIAEIQADTYDPVQVQQAKANFLQARAQMDEQLNAFMVELLHRISSEGRKRLKLTPK